MTAVAASSVNAQGAGGLMQLVAYGAQDVYLTPTTVATTFSGPPAPCSVAKADPPGGLAGLIFIGSGSIVNQCANVIAAPSTQDNNFLAIPASSTPATESVQFSAPQSTLLFSVAGTPAVSVSALLGEDVVGTGSFNFENTAQWQSIAVYNTPFDGVKITGGGDGNAWTLDDLYSTPETTVPEPATTGMLALGLGGFAAAGRRRRLFRGRRG
ncbi:MAG: PEP-CTERM sorting domain-containing protein [Gemmatimonadaceae bacterium]